MKEELIMSEKDIKNNEVPQNRDKEFLADPWARTRTRNGLAADEVISALQKSIRKGKERAACEFAYEMYISSPQMEEKLWRVYKLFQLKTLVWVILKHQFLLIA